MAENVFVLGFDQHNQRILDRMPDAAQCRFHPLLRREELFTERISFEGLLASARARLDAFGAPIDAIIGYWDFPVSAMLPLLRAHCGLATAPVEEVVMCEHKYWSRIVQQSVIDEYPRFGLVDPAHDRKPPAGVHYPMWIKPVKSFSSLLAFRVTDDDEFRTALARTRAGIDWVGEPFDELLTHVALPPEIAGIGGRFCLAEEAATGRQVTVEGYRYRGDVVVYGVVDSIHCANGTSFDRYQYPSTLPSRVRTRLVDITRRVVEAIGLESMTFDIEYFWNPATDTVVLLEINPRHSQSHATLFEDVDGVSNHQIMLRLALGRAPEFRGGRGRYAMAGKCFVRRFSDGVVQRIPTPSDIESVEAAVPGTAVEVVVEVGDRLSELRGQDSYSYEIARVYVGAADEADLTAKFERVVAALPFEIDELSGAEHEVCDRPATHGPRGPAGVDPHA